MNPAPDLILHNACIHTCNRHAEQCQAIALTGPLITAVGSNADILALRGPSTRVLDLQGRAVIPGMTDGHAHMDREGLRHHLPDLSSAHSIQDILDVIADEAANTPAGQWIVTQPIGRPPEYQDPLAALKEGRYPTRRDLDAVSPNHPVYIRPIWGYWRNQPPLVSVANSLALQRAGVTAETRAPSPDITIDRDDTGEPTGVFIERTLVPVVEHSLMRAAPGFSVDQRVSGLRHAMAVYNRYGTTAVFEGHGVADEVLEAYRRVHRQGEDSVRATLVFSPNWALRASGEASDLLRDWAGWLGGRGAGDARLRIQGIYTELDRDPLNNQLRAGNAPCTGWAGFQAGSALPEQALHALLVEAARQGVRVAGIWPDLLPAFERAHQAAPIDALRWVLGHQAIVTEEMMASIKALGIVLTTHTNRHIYKDGDKWLQRLPPLEQQDIVPLRRLLEAGVPVAFGSDNLPVSLFGPLWHAVSRLSRHGLVVAPEQALSRQQALDIAVKGGAYLTFDEHTRGSLEAGKLADLAVLSEDPLACPEAALPGIEALMTVVDGRIVHLDPLLGTLA